MKASAATAEGRFSQVEFHDRRGSSPPLTPPDPEGFARSAERYGCEIVGPPLDG